MTTCAICGRDVDASSLHPLSALTPGTRQAIGAEWPDLPPDAPICADDIAKSRRQYLEKVLEKERGELNQLDLSVLDALETGTPVLRHPGDDGDDDRTFGEKAADAVARFAGSWTFIIGFVAVLTLWMGLNVTGLIFGIFDPYPFILLNLALSSIAALQAPVIMMSQRRQEEKDREQSENDYKVNLKAELEIRHLHDKIDHHLMRQWEQLAAIQRLQIELLEDASGRDRG